MATAVVVAARMFSACRLQAPLLAMLSTNTFAPTQSEPFGSLRPTIQVALICHGVPRAQLKLKKPNNPSGNHLSLPVTFTPSRLCIQFACRAVFLAFLSSLVRDVTTLSGAKLVLAAVLTTAPCPTGMRFARSLVTPQVVSYVRRYFKLVVHVSNDVADK
jgi:hypothetical protein